jgi:eukaryotic-like serine/threonine-protein kinase
LTGEQRAPGPIRFGIFEADLRSGELRKQGVKLRIGDQPFSVLALLLAEPGQVVSRDELQRQLWPADTFVDFDRGLNKAINRLRDALGDAADSPRFIETLPKRGYRFIAEVANPPASAPPRSVAPTTAAADRPPARVRGTSARVTWIAAAVLGALAGSALVFLWHSRESPAATPTAIVRSSLLPPPHTAFVPYGMALSPSGAHLAFVAEAETGSRALYVRALATTTARMIAGTDGASLPFWSPDERSVGFFADRRLKTVDLAGGAVRLLADARRPSGGTWSAAGTIVFAPDVNGPLFQVAAAGGAPTAVTVVRPAGAPGVDGHRWPVFLPDGRHFLYVALVAGRTTTDDQGELRLGTLDGGDSVRIEGAPGVRAAAWALGHVFAVRAGTLYAYPFDLAKHQLGSPRAVTTAEVAGPAVVFPPAFSVAENGLLVFQSSVEPTSALQWIDGHGRELGLLAGARYGAPAIAPDGHRVAGSCEGPVTGATSICVFDLARGLGTRVTSGPADRFPVWSPDGRQIAYVSARGIERVSADGAGAPVLLSTRGIPTGWTRDGRILSFGTRNGVVSMALSSVEPTQVTELGPGAEGQLSPDGSWLAYLSAEGLTVERFPAAAPRVAVAGYGVAQPRWSRDGQRLFYVAADKKLMAVDFDPRLGLAGVPRLVTQTRIVGTSLAGLQYDVAPDGRFLINVLPPDPAPLTMMVNWSAALSR